jgi:hypothetical protein
VLALLLNLIIPAGPYPSAKVKNQDAARPEDRARSMVVGVIHWTNYRVDPACRCCVPFGCITSNFLLSFSYWDLSQEARRLRKKEKHFEAELADAETATVVRNPTSESILRHMSNPSNISPTPKL